jgi:hypothetical protein
MRQDNQSERDAALRRTPLLPLFCVKITKTFLNE